MTSDSPSHRIWTRFCQRFEIAQRAVPLFEVVSIGVVSQRSVGRAGATRPVLIRSQPMQELVVTSAQKLVDDWRNGVHRYDGMIYFMGWLEQDHFVPLYIGKTESFGRGDGNLSANIKGLDRDQSKFARWGDNYAYHFGDLSACVLPGHAEEKRTTKYQSWSTTLFTDASTLTPRLQKPVFFWTMAWDASQTGVWEELGPTSLAFLEYLLIGIAGRVSPHLLNREGVARGNR